MIEIFTDCTSNCPSSVTKVSEFFYSLLRNSGRYNVPK